MRRKSKLFCEVEHLELRQLLSTIYVDASATTGANNGTSWAAAYTSLQTALGSASTGTTIDVAAGDYSPGTADTDTFQLKSGVALQGGYVQGGSASPDPIANVTTLDGGGFNYHVVTGSGTNSTAVLDGFTVTGGNASGANGSNAKGGGIFDISGDPTLNDCIITGNTAGFGGGGLYAINDAPTLTDCTISGNTAGSSGGGMYIRFASMDASDCTITGNNSPGNGGGILLDSVSLALNDCTITGNSTPNNGGGLANVYSSLDLINCVIVGNTANSGAGMFNLNSSPTLINCTLTANAAGNQGGAIVDDPTSSATLVNCILWGDTASNGNEMYNAAGSSVTITYSDIDQSGFTGAGNIDADPMFISSNDLQLAAGSAAINAGSSGAIPAGITTDLAGNPRIIGGVADMGAYEYQTLQPIYVDASATGADNGTSWANAFTNLQSALTIVTSGAVIDVAQGIYYPTTGTDRSATFQLKDGVSLEGGFAGQADPTAAQNPATYPTILSGDIGTPGNNSDNSYHVVKAINTDSTAILNGFTITGGNFYHGSGDIYGGGILDLNGSPTINDCIITGNTAYFGGGIGIQIGSPIISDCIISGNTATKGGGGMATGGIGASPTLINCTITGNTAGTGGGGVYDNRNSSATLTNCILWDNTVSSHESEIITGPLGLDTATATYSDIDGGYAGAGNIDADPLFVDVAAGNLQIEPISPAVDAGSNAPFMPGGIDDGITTDLAGNPRIIGAAADMGAYEAVPALAANAGGPYNVLAGGSIQLTGYGSSNVAGPLSYGWSINNDGNFTDLTGADPVFSAAGYAAGTQIAITLRITDAGGNSIEAGSAINIVPPIIYVDAGSGAAGGGTGSDWADAYTSLAAALQNAVPGSGQTIEVAGGTYYPTAGANRTASFQLIDSVAIEGGFAGRANPSDPGERSAAEFPTLLSGDIGTPGNNSDNSYHVVTAMDTNSTAVLDGFTITDGNASGSYGNALGGGIYDYTSSPTISDCTITGNMANNEGAGIFNLSSSPTLTNCTLSGNTASGGGGMYNQRNSSPTLTNCILSGNTAYDGGGMLNGYSSPILTNCTLSGNTASQNGGGIYDFGSSPNLTNCILWGDTAPSGNEIFNSRSSGATITYSDVDGGYAGTRNIDDDPQFVRAIGVDGTNDTGDLRLQSGSLAISAGNPDAAGLSGILTDLDGLSRTPAFNDTPEVDMGAYQSHYAFQSTIYVDAGAAGAGTGSDWADAYPSLAAALSYAASGETIDVAQGIYYPSADGNRFDTFQLVSGAILQGGFAGDLYASLGAAGPAARDVSLYPTVLSGDIGTPGNNSDDSFHVVTARDTNSATTLDGFTITAGHANGGNFLSDGGGIYVSGGNPTISNCIIAGNTAGAGGGMYNTESSPTLINCIFSGNSGGLGGGMENDISSPILINCAFIGNVATNRGGGMSNSASSSPTLISCTFSGNSATNLGGGIANTNASATLINCTFSGNTTAGDGGGLAIVDGGSLTLINCTLSGNTASDGGGGIYINTAATLTNCILWDDTAASTDNEIANDGSLTITNSDIDDSSFVNSTSQVIDSDPEFTNPAGGDFQLQAASPAINAGSNAPFLSGGAAYGITTDLAGNSRIVGGTVDMGAYEYGAPITITSSSLAVSQLTLVFSVNIVTLSNDDLVFTAAGSTTPVYPAGASYNTSTDTVTFDLSNLAGGVYTASIAPSVISDASGNILSGGFAENFLLVGNNQNVVLPGGDQIYTVQAWTIGSNSSLDIGDNTLIIQYTTGNDPASRLASLIDSGYAGGQWNGIGIISSANFGEPANATGVGYFDNDSNQVTIRRTWIGDANLDGQINSDDLSLMMLGQAQGQTRWQDGNFNYDTQVNADDWSRLFYAAAYSNGQNISNVTLPAAAPAFSQTQITSADDLAGLLNSPASLL